MSQNIIFENFFHFYIIIFFNRHDSAHIAALLSRPAVTVAGGFLPALQSQRAFETTFWCSLNIRSTTDYTAPML